MRSWEVPGTIANSPLWERAIERQRVLGANDVVVRGHDQTPNVQPGELIVGDAKILGGDRGQLPRDARKWSTPSGESWP